MATIKEMAALYALNYHVSCIAREDSFIAGANAVLKEIENILDITKPYLGNPFATLEERARGVYDLVKELKGE